MSSSPFCWGGGGGKGVGGGRVEPPTKFSKRGHLIGPLLLEPQLLKVTKNLVTFKRKDSVKDEKL